MKLIRFLFVVLFALSTALALSSAAPLPAAHAATHVPDGLTPADWAQIQSLLAPEAVATFNQQAKLTASDAATNDGFGNAVAVSGNTAVISTPYDDDGGSESGSAYVFVRSGGSWSQQAKLTASDATGNDRFGTSVAVSGDTAVIGAPYDDDNGTDTGSAYVFVRSGVSWSQQAKLPASDPANGDYFGTSVAVSGDTAVVGTHLNNGGAINSGSAYVFVRSGVSWSQQTKLTASDANVSDYFGYAVAVSGDTAVIGAFLDDDGGTDSGSAYVFIRSGVMWSQQAKLTASDAAGTDAFGWSIAVSDDTVVVGARFDDDGGPDTGSAYVFGRSGVSWSQQAKLTASDAAANDQFGISVAVSGNTAVVGAFADDNGLFTESGSAYIFDCVRSIQTGAWEDTATWGGAAVPLTTDGVCIESGHTVTMNGNDAIDQLWVYAGGTLNISTHTLTVEKSVSNEGTLRQTRTVNNANVEFLHIQNAAQTITQYRGVVLDASLNGGNNLGNTTVTVRELNSGEYCTNTGASSPAYARRCFDISPTSQPATNVRVRLYGRTADELNGIAPANLVVYRNNPTGSNTWLAQMTNASTGNDGGAYSYAQGEVAGFSPFLLGAAGQVPTAVSLSALAANQPTPFFIIGSVLLLLLLTSLRWLAIRRP